MIYNMKRENDTQYKKRIFKIRKMYFTCNSHCSLRAYPLNSKYDMNVILICKRNQLFQYNSS